MGLKAANAANNQPPRREREAKEDASHCIAKSRTAASASTALESSAKGRSAASAANDELSCGGGGGSGSPTGASSQPSTVARYAAPASSAASKSPPRRHASPSSSASKQRRRGSGGKKMMADPSRCFDKPRRIKRDRCVKVANWRHGKYARDECGSGIVPVRKYFQANRKNFWCKTPLSMYQATIGDLGRKILCREKIVPRDIHPGPPCTVCDDILPPCRGYYRKYECIRPCEEEYTVQKGSRKIYRPIKERYWDPCQMVEQNGRLNINEYAGQNVFLASQMRRDTHNIPCW